MYLAYPLSLPTTLRIIKLDLESFSQGNNSQTPACIYNLHSISLVGRTLGYATHALSNCHISIFNETTSTLVLSSLNI